MAWPIRSFVLALASATLAWAQLDANKSSLGGRVLDPSGAGIANARVTVTNRSTGMERQAATAPNGDFRLSALDPGTYTAQAESPGYARATVQNILLTVGANVEQDITVSLETITMVVDPVEPLLAPTASAASQVIGREAIRDLPINGRRFQDFATLTPAAQAPGETRGQLSLVGQRGINSNVMVDGADYNEPYVGGIRGGDRSNFAFTVPQSGIQEFQAVTAGYTAEYGRSTGGVLNAVTRSGGNGFHGEAFYQLRHKELGLENPLRQQSLETQHQFGGAIGGPIVADRLFFFASAEQQFAAFPRLVRFPALDTVASNVTPDIAPAYQYFRLLEGPFTQTNDATAALGRLDYQFGPGSRLTLRYNHSLNRAQNAVALASSLNTQTNSALSNNGDEKDSTDTAVAQYTAVLSATLLNDARIEFSREKRPRTANAFTPTVIAGIIGTYGAGQDLPSLTSDYRQQVADALTVIRGAHTLKAGVDFSHIRAAQTSGFNQWGTFSIASSDVRGILQLLSRAGGPAGNRLDDPSVLYLRQCGSLNVAMTAQQLAFFTADSWRIKPSLTLDYGLRWEAQFNPSPGLDNEFLVSNVLNFPFPLGPVDPGAIRDQRNQWAPRLGVAWNIGGRSETVLRAQAGLFYAQTPLVLYAAPLTDFQLPGGDLTLQLAPNATGTVYRQFQRAGFDFNLAPLNGLPVFTVADVWMKVAGQPNQWAQSNVITTSGNRFRNPRAFQTSFGIEHRLSSNLTIDYQLNHINTVHLERNIDYNVPLPFVRPGDLSLRPFFGLRSGTSRPNPNLGAVLVRDSNARSNYTGSTLRAQYRSRRFQFAANYTLGYNKSDDDNERSLTGTTYQNPFDLRREYNWSSLDARHMAAGYAIFQAPLGIELAALFHYRSGLPLDATTGVDSSELLTGPVGNRPLEAPGVPFLRNAFRNRGLKSFDLRFLKDFTVREAARLQFSCEMFNLFNFENLAFLTTEGYLNPALIYGPGILPSGNPAPPDPGFLQTRKSTGQLDPAAVGQLGTPFQVQMGLRFIF